MKKFFITTALVTGLAMPVFADAHKGDMTFFDSTQENTVAAAELRVSDLIGKRVYTSENDVDTVANDADEGWEDIGEINDVIMSRDGKMRAVLLDIGGFLGMGEKTVAVNMDELKLVADGDDAGDYFVVFTSNRASLEGAPAFDPETVGGWTDASADMDNAEAVEETAEADTTATVPPTGMMRDGYETYDRTQLTTEMVTGAAVYDTNDEHIGEVSELILNDAGEITEAVIDVGGFLGLGEKPVALSIDELDILRQTDGDDLRIYVDHTQESLEAMPEWEQG
ncbi:PRC-barrel domain-containing protein [Litoreibacter arenae]|uniref:Hydrogenase maturation factor n=1 Tax=Litoreibacter arenae DSM 19593 TaxID=1123360 RepID=S9QCE5_9RHOB|nr:PRC-barrel domain-containing protein [Litoreibacter arenae]EPX77268.1 Hydrogenase maturation factor [Litoreibacter arenae DSM 19593]